jgi:subtilisin family serine protease
MPFFVNNPARPHRHYLLLGLLALIVSAALLSARLTLGQAPQSRPSVRVAANSSEGLINALWQANQQSVLDIYLMAGTYNLDSIYPPAPISADLRIFAEGGPAIIRLAHAGPDSASWRITSGAVVALHGLHFVSAEGIGRALINEGALSVSDSFFTSEGGEGGGISNSGTLALARTRFNQTIYRATNTAGGAVANSGQLMAQCTRFENSLAAQGGAIFNSGQAEITSSLFRNNVANGGGAIFNVGGQVLVGDSYFANPPRLELLYRAADTISEGVEIRDQRLIAPTAENTAACSAPPVPAGPSDLAILGDTLKLEEADYQALLAEAQQDGQTRIIVEVRLTTPYKTDFGLSNVAAQSQRASIKTAQAGLLRTVAGSAVVVNAQYQFMPYLALTVDAGALRALAYAVGVISIEPDRIAEKELAQSTPLVGAPNVWAAGYTGAGWTVAVIDDGVSKTHPFLTGKVVSEACYASDCTITIGDGAATPCTNCSHGTHVAGIAVGTNANFSGVAKNANLIAVRVFASDGNAAFSDINLALERVYALRTTYNIAAVNMSLAVPRDYHLSHCDSAYASTKTAIDNLRAAGIATIIASGNYADKNGPPYTNGIAAPACISTAVSVGATTKTDTLAIYSQGGALLSLLAPGDAITSSVLSGGYQSQNGTSMAAPHVAGAWALLRQFNSSNSVSTWLATLQSSGVALYDARNATTKSRIQVDAALGISAPNNLISSGILQTVAPIAYSQNINGSTVSASDPDLSCLSAPRDYVNTVWYRFVPTAFSNLALDTALSGYDTVLGVYTGVEGAMTLLACSDDDGALTTSRVLLAVNAGTTYHLMIAKKGAVPVTAATTLRLNANFQPLDNDLYESAKLVGRLPANFAQAVETATETATDPAMCVSGRVHTIWYRFTAPYNAPLVIDTEGSGYDTVLGAYTGQPGGFLQLACNDDIGGGIKQSRITLNVSAGSTYYFMVAKWGGVPLSAPNTARLNIGFASSAAISVTNTNDSGAGSLRQALTDANANGNFSVITFNIAGGGNQVITPSTPLPVITQPIYIDGYTQPGSQAAAFNQTATLRILINGASAGANQHGLVVNAHNSTVRGLAIYNFGGAGLVVNNLNALVEGCYLGTNGTSALPNLNGIVVNGLNATIGGESIASRNLISGNSQSGVVITAGGAALFGNYIGTDSSGTADLGNGADGITVSNAPLLRLGGWHRALYNVISGNNGYGLYGLLADSHQAALLGNTFGQNPAETISIANSKGNRRIDILRR